MKFEKFGKYMLLKRLAVGGMAEIFLAKKTGVAGVAQFVVVKRILPQYSSNKNFVEMFKNEGRIAAHLKHSNLVHIQDFGEYRGAYFIEMEYISGCSLKDLLKTVKKHYRYFPVEYAVYIVRSVASALNYIHNSINQETGKKLNAIHRDISPHNIMVSYSGDVKMIDFGIAKVDESNLTVSGVVKGKFSYMSPEQTRGKKLDCRSDIFSLGVVFWELLCGQKLFQGSNMQNIMEKIKECKIPPVSQSRNDVSSSIEKILQKAMHKDKAKRYNQASEMVLHFNQFLNSSKRNFSSSDFQVFIEDLYKSTLVKERENIVFLSNKLKEVEKRREINLKTKSQVFSEDPNPNYMHESREGGAENIVIPKEVKHKKIKPLENNLEQLKNSSKKPTPQPQSEPQSEDQSEKQESADSTYVSSRVPSHLLKTNVEPDKNQSLKVTDKSASVYEASKDNFYYISLQKTFRQRRRNLAIKNFLGVCVFLALLGGLYLFFQDEVSLFVENLNPSNRVQLKKSFDQNARQLNPVSKRIISSQRDPSSLVKIFVQTVPSGGSVFLNNERIPGKTPLTISVPQNSKSEIMIQKEGYKIHRVQNPLNIGNTLEVKLRRKKQKAVY